MFELTWQRQVCMAGICETIEVLPAVLHSIPLAAWISVVCAGNFLSGTAAASGCSIRGLGESLGSDDSGYRNGAQNLLHGGFLFKVRLGRTAPQPNHSG
jgi:hypothetical protein